MDNYSAWSTRPTSFPFSGSRREQLLFLLRLAIMAPSGHNSQPWKFKIHDRGVDFFVNEERSLRQSDTNRRQLCIAFGCCVENFLIAADYFGFQTNIVDFSSAIDQPGSLVLTVLCSGSAVASPSLLPERHLCTVIPARQTNRLAYEKTVIPDVVLAELSALAIDGVRVDLVAVPEKRKVLADIALSAGVEAMESLTFREELSHYVKSNYTKSAVGMPGFTLGLPGPVSLLLPLLIKKVNASKMSVKQDQKLFQEQTPCFGIISTEGDRPDTWLKAGKIFEHLWLVATKNGLSVSPLASAIQVAGYPKKLQEILEITERPQVFFRMGYSTRLVRHSPRMSVDSFIVH